MTRDDYLRSVERMLRGIDPAHRTDVLEDLRGHFADAEETGLSVEEIIRGLGTPEQIAERAVEEFGVPPEMSDARAERAWRVMQIAAVILGAAIGLFVAFTTPTHSTTTGTVSSDGTNTYSTTTRTLIDAMGFWIVAIALVAPIVATVPLVVSRAARTATTTVCAALLTAMTIVSGFTIGRLFVPVVVLLWAAVIVRVRLRGTGFGLGWRVAGCVLTVLPMLPILPTFGAFGGSALFGARRRYADYTEGSGPSVGLDSLGWVIVVAVFAVAALIVVGYRWAGWALAAIGLAALLTGLISGSLLSLMFIWLGGWWLTIGLAHAVTASRRA
jgi:uncharacterized membrane protein